MPVERVPDVGTGVPGDEVAVAIEGIGTLTNSLGGTIWSAACKVSR